MLEMDDCRLSRCDDANHTVLTVLRSWVGGQLIGHWGVQGAQVPRDIDREGII